MNGQRRRPWQTVIVALIVIGILLLALGGFLSSIIEWVLSPIFTAQEWLTTRYQAFRDFFSAPTDLARLRQQNAQLEAEISRLQTQVIDLQQQVTEVDILSALLDFARAQPQNEYKAASVINRDPRPFMKYVVINLGSDDGVLSGMPVVGAEGLVGRVVAVNATGARVELITDPASLVDIRIQPADVDSILIGSITSDLFLDLIPQGADVQPGDLILTSGLGGSYPPNIIVGQVASVRTQATALFQTAAVQPVVDFSRLEIVLVIINFRPVDISPLLPEEVPAP
jgi:rod shape-determining protein MreC